MNAPLIVLHEEALRATHPVFNAAPQGTKAIYVWDDAYLRQANHNLKRLIFIYETLCTLPVDIIKGNTARVIQELAPAALYVPATNNPLIVEIIQGLKAAVPVQIIEDEAFAPIKNPTDFTRFFQYWKKAEKSAYMHNGGVGA
jgi:hypothetical protein